jgi:hypothetical protein
VVSPAKTRLTNKFVWAKLEAKASQLERRKATQRNSLKEGEIMAS